MSNMVREDRASLAGKILRRGSAIAAQNNNSVFGYMIFMRKSLILLDKSYII